MKQPRINRRQFFKLSAFSAAAAVGLPAIGLAAIAAAPSQEAIAAAEQPHAPAVPQPTFNPISSNTTFGALTDISMGWDGTLWGIDAQGAPHVYDEINKMWASHGEGIDAAALSVEPGAPGAGAQWTLYVFQGPNVIAINPDTLQASPPTTIAALWPNLPDSFKLGVSGAMANEAGFGLILFNGGRYVSTDGTVPLGNLTDLTNWPQTPIWKDGVIDGASEEVDGLFRSGEYLHISIRNKTVVEPPQPFSVLTQYVPMPAAWAASGVDGWTFLPAQRTQILIKGTAVFAYNVDTKVASPLSYLGNTFANWPATWHPVLAHAPNGRDGNLWSVLPPAQGSWIVQHDGDNWTKVPNQADHVGVGQDNTVMIASAQKLWRFTGALDGSGFTPVSPANNLIQVSLGNSNSVYARDANNNVYSFNASNGSLTPNATAPTATHIAAAYDGSLWHAKPSDANMHRYLSGPNVVDAIPVKQGIVSTVTKVAATGFGAAHCLVQQSSGPASTTPSTVLYRYDSPYVFKTAGSYFSTGKHIEQGLGRLYMTVEDKDPVSGATYSAVLAMDPHTGKELARTALRDPNVIYSTPVYDRVHHLVFVGYAPFDPRVLDRPGAVVALDPLTLQVKWILPAERGVDVAPTLIQNDLYFADRGARIYKLDIAAAIANPNAIAPAWTAVPPLNPQPPYTVGWGGLRGVSQFAFHEDSVYCTVWDIGFGCHYDNNDPFNRKIVDWISQTAVFLQIKVADGALSQRNPPNPIPPGQPMAIVNGPVAFGVEKMYAFPPLRFDLPAPTPDRPTRTVPALFVNGGFSVFIYLLPNPLVSDGIVDGTFAAERFDLPGGLDPNVGIVYTADMITTGFAYDDGTRGSASQNVLPSVWFGALGDPIVGSPSPRLFSVNTQLKAANGTPAITTDQPNTLIRTTPVLFRDSTDQVTVWFGLSDAGNAWFPSTNPDSPSLAGLYNFSVATGTVAGDIETGTTQLTALTPQTNNGVIYGVGSKIVGTEFAQVFGIRVDQLVQDERDFIIEADLMQDFDSTSQNFNKDMKIPPSVARYKAHVTIVDDNKKPRPKEPVKIWCDTAGTVINVNGTSYTVGPDDDQYALVQTDVDGVLVFSLNATDINAPEFRLWAGFMDPYERIVAFVDQQWHDHMTNATNNYTDDGTNPDPQKPNLSTVHNYRGEPLYDSDDKADNVPQKVANSIAQMKNGASVGQAGPAALAKTLKTLHATNSAASYVAYTDLPVMHYLPNNAQARRPALAGAPTGFVFSRDAVTKKSTFTPMTHSDARNQMDSVTQGVARWDPNSVSVNAALQGSRPQGAGAIQSKRKNGFQKLWDWIKQGLAAIENVIVSVTDEVLTTISMILPDGARQVFQWVAQAIEDVVNVIGMIINMFETAIDDFIAAIGLNTFFDELFNTQDWMTKQINYLATEFGNYMVSDVKPVVDQKIEDLETDVTNFFDEIKNAFDGQSITNLQGGNTTPHSAFTVGTPAKSHAVACMDNIHTLKTQMRNATVKPTAMQLQMADGTGDPVLDFITTFIQSLQTDPVLSKAISDVKSDVSNLFTSSGLANLMTNAMDTILDIIKLLIVGAFAVAKAFLDGIFVALADLITQLMNALNAEIEIPILSELYQFFFDQPLTLLNAITLVIAFVINLVYRIVENKYPSQDGVLSKDIVRTPPAMRAAGGASTTTAADAKGQMIIGVIAGVLELAYGIFNAVNDGEGDDAPAAFGPAATLTGVLVSALTAPWISTDDPDEDTRVVWGCLSMLPSILAILGLKPGIDSGGKKVMSFGLALFALMNLIITCNIYRAKANPKTSDKLNLASGICSCIPTMVNPATNIEPFGPPAVAIIDVLGYGIAGGCMIAVSILLYQNPDQAVLERRRLFVPFISNGLSNPRAIPLTAGNMP
jgi:hypothetical protein